MKKWLVWAGLGVMLLGLALGASAQSERKVIFRGLAFGDPPELLGHDVSKYEPDEFTTVYFRYHEEPFGSIPVQRIEYVFLHDESLFMIAARFLSRYKVEIEGMLRARYGEPNQFVPGHLNKYWVIPDLDLMLLLEEPLDQRSFSVAWTSISLLQQLEELRERKLAEEAQKAW